MRLYPKPGLVEQVPHVFAFHLHREFGGADVARFLQHLRHGKRAMRVRIGDGGCADGEAAGRGLDHGIGPYLGEVERECHGERLDRRTRFKRVGEHTVAQLRARQCCAVVRIEGRQIGECQHFAAACIEDDDAAGLGPVRFNRLLQLTECEVLNLAVDGEHEILAFAWGGDAGDVFDNIAAPVFDHAAAACLARERGLMCEFDALLPCFVHTGETEHMRGHFPGRVIAPVLALLMDAGNIEQDHALGLLGRQLALEVDKFTVVIGELSVKLLERQLQHGSELAHLIARRLHVFGDRPH